MSDAPEMRTGETWTHRDGEWIRAGSPRIEPALTAEEWREAEAHQGLWCIPNRVRYAGEAAEAPPHALAALALYGQPFGFTREDVFQLRAMAVKLRDFLESETGKVLRSEHPVERFNDGRWADDLADRIAALLPPETP